MSRKTVNNFLRIKVGGHFVMSIVKCHESHYVGLLDNPRTENAHANPVPYPLILRTVPTIVIPHTFYASRDTGIFYG